MDRIGRGKDRIRVEGKGYDREGKERIGGGGGGEYRIETGRRNREGKGRG